MSKLKEYRIKNNISQEKLAKEIGVTATLVGFWENGKRELPVRHAKKIAQILNVNWWELYD